MTQGSREGQSQPTSPWRPVGDGPLADLRVVDAATLLAGPMIATYLADFGADVIKVEHPRGDALRSFGWQKDGVSIWWKTASRNKRSCTLNLSHPAAQELMVRLVRDADVLIENFRPGTLERWNLSPERLAEVNPRLVIVRTTGFGQDGPYSSRPAFGTVVEAMSGVAWLLGEQDGPPIVPPFPMGDGVAALLGAMATMTALRERDVSGVGQSVDLSLLEGMVAFMGPHVTAYDAMGVVEHRNGSRAYFGAPRNAYRTGDGRWVVISTSAQSAADRLLRAIGRAELLEQGDFDTAEKRVQRADELDDLIAAWVRERPLDEVLRVWEEHSVAGAPVYSVADLVADEHVRARSILIDVEDDELGHVRMHGVFPRLSRTPGHVRHAGRPLGADNQEVFGRGLGVEPSQLRALRAAGTI
jgi:crotonobetainyl-CoA:carnitine CoA-transferase CaiB-like acyl-CoA transferase